MQLHYKVVSKYNANNKCLFVYKRSKRRHTDLGTIMCIYKILNITVICLFPSS